jgi:hypothetical protein
MGRDGGKGTERAERAGERERERRTERGGEGQRVTKKVMTKKQAVEEEGWMEGARQEYKDGGRGGPGGRKGREGEERRREATMRKAAQRG